MQPWMQHRNRRNPEISIRVKATAGLPAVAFLLKNYQVYIYLSGLNNALAF